MSVTWAAKMKDCTKFEKIRKEEIRQELLTLPLN